MQPAPVSINGRRRLCQDTVDSTAIVPFSPVHSGSTGLRRPQKSILLFWLPLAATWLMMAAEGPFLAAVIARLADPTFNLAAYGVALALAMLVEAPIIMIMSASTALAEDAESFRRLRNFTYALNAAITAVLLLVLVPPVFRVLMYDLIGLREEVARLAYPALWIFLPWPGAIGYRRFYQGLLIRDGLTRRVAYGTVVRLTTMAGTGLALALLVDPPGAYVGAAALTMGVSAEAVASRWMARRTIAKLRVTQPTAEAAQRPLTYRRILRIYYPLGLTSVIAFAVQPVMTFFMGRAPASLESLAVFPVVAGLSFIFRSMGLSYQEAAIALVGKRFEHLPEVGRFALRLGLLSSAALMVVAITPLAVVWYQTVSGLTPELTRFAIVPTILLIPVPALTVFLSLQCGVLVVSEETRPITWATAIELSGVAIGFPVLAWGFGMVGVTAGVAAFVVGRTAGVLYLIPPYARMVKRGRERLAPAHGPELRLDLSTQ